MSGNDLSFVDTKCKFEETADQKILLLFLILVYFVFLLSRRLFAALLPTVLPQVCSGLILMYLSQMLSSGVLFVLLEPSALLHCNSYRAEFTRTGINVSPLAGSSLCEDPHVKRSYCHLKPSCLFCLKQHILYI